VLFQRIKFLPDDPYDTSPEVGPAEKKHVQAVNGKWLWFGRAVDGTILTALSALAAQQSKPTEKTMKQVKQLLDYIVTQESAILTYQKSDMVLAGHSNAGYLNKKNASERVAIISFPKTCNIPPTTVQYSTLSKSFRQSCLLPQKQRSEGG
jgi:hypothetical protein